jgi:hypothetical protein
MKFGVSSFMMAAAMTVVVCLVGSASAFVQPSGKTSSLNSVASQQAKDPLHILPLDAIEIPYGEESRKFRRTVYTHDDWIKHRSPDRFFKTLRTTTTSGIYKVRIYSFVCLSLTQTHIHGNERNDSGWHSLLQNTYKFCWRREERDIIICFEYFILESIGLVVSVKYPFLRSQFPPLFICLYSRLLLSNAHKYKYKQIQLRMLDVKY